MMNAETGLMLWQGLWVSSAATLLVLLLRHPWRRLFGASSVPLLWAMVPLSLLAIALPESETARQALPALPLGNAIMAIGPTAPTLQSATTSLTLWTGLGLLWLVGSLLSAAYFAWLQQRFHRQLGPLQSRPDGTRLASGAAVGPAVIGLLRPRIVLPADFTQRYSEEQQALILTHERSHLQRGDLLANAIATGLRCLYWFNPLIHFAADRLRHDHELASDAAVLRQHPHARRRYADTLLNVQLAAPGLPVGCLWQSSHPLKERIMQIKQPLPARSRHWIGLALGLCVLTGSALTAWAAGPSSTSNPKVASSTEEVDVTPSYRALKPPKYPQAAIDAKQAGNVVLRVKVGIDGMPAEAEVERSTDSEHLDAAAIAAVKGWKFNPAQKDGQPVESWVLVPICFSLDEQVSCEAAAPEGLDGIYIKGEVKQPG